MQATWQHVIEEHEQQQAEQDWAAQVASFVPYARQLGEVRQARQELQVHVALQLWCWGQQAEECETAHRQAVQDDR